MAEAASRRRRVTQAEFAIMMGETQQAISKLLAKGHMTRGADVTQWLVEYGCHMRKVAAGWQSLDGSLDRIQEAARLDRRKAELLEIELAEKRSELIPAAAVLELLKSWNATIRAKLLALPARQRSMSRNWTSRDVDNASELVREILDELRFERFPPEIRAIVERYMAGLHAAAETNSEGMGRPLSDT